MKRDPRSTSLEKAKHLWKHGHSRAAEMVASEIFAQEPWNLDAIAMLLDASKARGDHQAIDRLTRAALERRPADLYFMSVRAESFFHAGDIAKAIDQCDHALSTWPGEEIFLRIKALCHEFREEFETALFVLSPLLTSSGSSAEVLSIAGRILHGLKRFDDAIALTRPIAEDARQSADVRQRIWFQLAKTYDRVGNYAAAMHASASAHALSGGRFDVSDFLASVEDLMTTFSRANMRALARATNRSEVPVFVIGMPRSGTTLVEQVIHAHPHGFGAGELLDIEEIAKSIGVATESFHSFPHNVVDLTTLHADQFAERYLDRLAAMSTGASRVVNKMLEQYNFVGLIWMLFPLARIVHVRRNALDTCLSCYTRHLNPLRLTYARNLEHLGLVYRQHERLMNHWKATLDLPILDVQYEELVANQEAQSRRLIEFLGLPWDDRCLRYWETDRRAMTLSYDQVSRPIYDSSIGRWRNYEAYLEPLKAALETET